ncbi:unnamed protein product [Urochloa humidicola]
MLPGIARTCFCPLAACITSGIFQEHEVKLNLMAAAVQGASNGCCAGSNGSLLHQHHYLNFSPKIRNGL